MNRNREYIIHIQSINRESVLSENLPTSSLSVQSFWWFRKSIILRPHTTNVHTHTHHKWCSICLHTTQDFIKRVFYTSIDTIFCTLLEHPKMRAVHYMCVCTHTKTDKQHAYTLSQLHVSMRTQVLQCDFCVCSCWFEAPTKTATPSGSNKTISPHYCRSSESERLCFALDMHARTNKPTKIKTNISSSSTKQIYLYPIEPNAQASTAKFLTPPPQSSAFALASQFD